jgi:hypothetical protein
VTHRSSRPPRPPDTQPGRGSRFSRCAISTVSKGMRRNASASLAPHLQCRGLGPRFLGGDIRRCLVSLLADNHWLSLALGRGPSRSGFVLLPTSKPPPISLPFHAGLISKSRAMKTANSEEGLVKTRIAIDQTRLSRLATQNSIERSRRSLAETRTVLNALRDALLSRQYKNRQESGDPVARLLKNHRQLVRPRSGKWRSG